MPSRPVSASICTDWYETGALKLGNVGAIPITRSSLKRSCRTSGNGYNLSVAVYEEFNTQNQVTHYTSGNILHADFTATKTFGKWTIGPVAYYQGQQTDDSCPLSCVALYWWKPDFKNAARTDFSVWAVGGLLAYDFGPAAVSVWATQEVSQRRLRMLLLKPLSAPILLRCPRATVFATLSYRLWGPEEPVKPAMYHK